MSELHNLYKITIYSSADESEPGSIRVSTIRVEDGFETAYLENDIQIAEVKTQELAEAAGAHKAFCALLLKIMEDVPFKTEIIFGNLARKYEDERN